MAEKSSNLELRETWDRLVLLLLAQPREGWAHEFREITRRGIQQLAPPEENEAGHDEQS